LLFRGVEVAAGHHRIEFRFDPLSLDNLMAAAGEVVASEFEEPETVTVSQVR